MMVRSAALRKRVYKRDLGRCSVCGVFDAKWECDHVVDIQFGGKDTLDNLQTLCRRHHRDKTVAATPVRAKADRLRERHELTLARRKVAMFEIEGLKQQIAAVTKERDALKEEVNRLVPFYEACIAARQERDEARRATLLLAEKVIVDWQGPTEAEPIIEDLRNRANIRR